MKGSSNQIKLDVRDDEMFEKEYDCLTCSEKGPVWSGPLSDIGKLSKILSHLLLLELEQLIRYEIRVYPPEYSSASHSFLFLH